MEEVVAIAEQTASGTQQVASTAKQLSGSMQELTSSSQNLNDIAADLQISISAFKLIDGNLVFNASHKGGRQAVLSTPRKPIKSTAKKANSSKS